MSPVVSRTILLLVSIGCLIRSVSGAVCVYVNCEPVEDFLASPTAPHIISHCVSCNECVHSNFSTCTLVHSKETETKAHCVCGNTLPTTCTSDHVPLADILDRNATLFEHDYMCSFSMEDSPNLLPHLLPHLEEVRIPQRENEEASFRVPIETLLNTRRYHDLQFKNLFLYFLNESESENVKSTPNFLMYSDPSAQIQLSKEGQPISVEPEDAVNVTQWPKVTFPVSANLPTAVAYSIDHQFHRLIPHPENKDRIQNASFAYSQLTPAVTTQAHEGPNYTLVVLIVVGSILLIGLCCAAISCRDKLKHRKVHRGVSNSVAGTTDMESGKSAAVAGHPQTYTLIRNGGHGNDGGVVEPEKIHLLTYSGSPNFESATLPSGSTLRDTNGSLRHKQPQHQTLPIVVSSGARPVGAGIQPGSKTDIDQRSPGAVEADRKKYLGLVKDSTVLRAADLDLLESIGSGEFGVIRRGYVFDRTEAMIHCLKPPHKQPTDAAAESLTERLDSSVKAGFHPNIISLLGLCHEADILYVCLQLETGPNLRNMLRESRSLDQFLQYTNARGRLSLMSPQRLLNIILGLARGMGHLEECQVLHDNLAAVNIVICDNGNPKIAGFGMATLSDLYMRQLEKNHDQLRWLPPETHDTGLFTMKSQTWSFGVVLWEIITFGGTPYYEMSDDEVVHRVAEGYRLPRTSNCSRQLYDLMEQCWRAHGEDRPDFLSVQQHVHELNLDPELHISVTFHDGFKYQPIREPWNT